MDFENRIINFGHDPIPNEVYEDYKKMEELKHIIEEIIESSDLKDEYKINAVKQLFLSMHNHYEKMKPQSFNRPCK